MKSQKIYYCGDCDYAKINLSVEIKDNMSIFRITNTGTVSLRGEFIICSDIIDKVTLCDELLVEGEFIEVTRPYIAPVVTETNDLFTFNKVVAFVKIKNDIWIYDEIKARVPVVGTYLNVFSGIRAVNNTTLLFQVMCGNARFSNVIPATNLKSEIKLPKFLIGNPIVINSEVNCSITITGDTVIISAPTLLPGQTCGAFFTITHPVVTDPSIIHITSEFTSDVKNLSGILNKFLDFVNL